jgi:(R,R)-butanediol dehydrogenase / meso-butanediol dehydrogenase / diacetyl reductase
MKAAVWHSARDIRVEEAPEPKLAGPDEALVEVAFCGICGTDLHEYTDGPQYIPVDEPHPLTGDRAPVHLGHEYSGTVVEVGREVTQARVGDRVAVFPIQSCQQCAACKRGYPSQCPLFGGMGLHVREGGLARTSRVKGYQLFPMPDSLTFQQGALVEPAAVAVHAVDNGGVRPGDFVLVTGGGPIGQLVAMAAKAAGARSVYLSEVTEFRRELAKKSAEPARVLNPSQDDVVALVQEATDGWGADVVLECSGSPRAFPDALAATRKGGTMVQVAVFTREVPLQPADLTNFERRLQGTLIYQPQDFPRTMELIASGKLPAERIVTAEIPLSDVLELGFDELIRPDTRHAKVLVHPD